MGRSIRILRIFAMVSLITLTLLGFAPPTWNASQVAFDERTLGVNASPAPVVLAKFRANMLTPDAAREVRILIDQLGSDDFRTRDKAHDSLGFWGGGAEGLLRRHLFDDNLERRRRARQLVDKGLGRWSIAQAEAAARLLRKSPSPEAARTLIEYLPYAEDAGVRREVAAALRDFAGQSAAVKEMLREIADPAVLSLLKDEASPTLLAVDRARGFFTLVGQAEIVKLADATRLPFALGNGVILTSPDQRDDFFRQAAKNFNGKDPAAVTLLHAVRGDDFLRFATEEEREFLSPVPIDELRAVHVRVRRDWQTEELGVVLIRSTPTETRVIGLAQTGIRKKS